MNTRNRLGEPFFFWYSCLVFAVVTFGFASHAILIPEDLPPFSLIVAWHGVSMLLWYLLFVVQTGLIRLDKTSVHMGLGKMSLVLSISIILSGLAVSYFNYRRSGNPFIVIANSTSLLNFVILYSTALVRRNIPDSHKRLMLFASLILIAPALARIAYVSGLSEFAAIPVWALLFLAVVPYDIYRLKRIYPATIFGIFLFALGVVLILSLAGTELLKGFLDSLIGRS